MANQLRNWNPSAGNVTVDDFLIVPERLYVPFWFDQIMPISTIAHEFGHMLGLPDLYGTDANGNEVSYGIGRWGLMRTGPWNKINTDADCPAHMEAWSKYFLGWV
jgi:M6 family metalloprotease-like protein